MRRQSAASATLPLALFLLGGCAAQGPFPSLAPRPIERQLANEPDTRPAPNIPSDPALTGRAASLLAAAREGNAAFEAAYERASAAAGRAGGAGSETWVAAQQEVSRAQAARAPTVNALADLDRLAIEAANRPASAADQAAIREALAAAQRLADSQHERLEALRSRLSGP